MNAHCERVIGTVRREVLDHVLIMNEAHARQVLAEYQDHYNRHRPHRSQNQRPADAQEQSPAVAGFKAPQAPTDAGPRGSHQRVPLRMLSCSDEFSSPTGSRTWSRRWLPPPSRPGSPQQTVTPNLRQMILSGHEKRPTKIVGRSSHQHV
ncbi:integrase core domain-containing protein [Kutzneria sp. NPDC051319]|uniref:integrase core domain-containing protein n=1 Tax=Kutzneria sp. NPDC051319 TaxID=3155047 RepID=UPI00344AEA95